MSGTIYHLITTHSWFHFRGSQEHQQDVNKGHLTYTSWGIEPHALKFNSETILNTVLLRKCDPDSGFQCSEKKHLALPYKLQTGEVVYAQASTPNYSMGGDYPKLMGHILQTT